MHTHRRFLKLTYTLWTNVVMVMATCGQCVNDVFPLYRVPCSGTSCVYVCVCLCVCIKYACLCACVHTFMCVLCVCIYVCRVCVCMCVSTMGYCVWCSHRELWLMHPICKPSIFLYLLHGTPVKEVGCCSDSYLWYRELWLVYPWRNLYLVHACMADVSNQFL